MRLTKRDVVNAVVLLAALWSVVALVRGILYAIDNDRHVDQVNTAVGFVALIFLVLVGLTYGRLRRGRR